jgi:hypothetical protein
MARAVQRYYVWIACVFAFIGVARIVSTYGQFSQTYDEPWHIAGGVEWLERGVYTAGLEHPPLGRVATAIGPYLLGAKAQDHKDPIDQGNTILSSGQGYWRLLTAARAGTILFFVSACGFVFLWARRWFGRVQAVLAVLLFSCLPPILGHSALATVDVAQAATLTGALYCLLRWLESRSARWTWLAGITLGLALLAKLSNLAFYAVCCAIVLAVRRPARPLLLRQSAVFVVAALLTIWSGYRWSVRPLSASSPIRQLAVKNFGENSQITKLATRAADIPIPLSEFAAGIIEVYHFGSAGHHSYLLGEYRRTGWWHFFPVVLSVKTPLAFLALVFAGVWIAVRRTTAAWQVRATALLPVGILFVCVLSRLDLGVRHALSIYPLLSILVAHAAAKLLAAPRLVLRATAAALIAFVVVESAIAHPDYLASFNVLAGKEPERILCESDLDWGQDLPRLSRRLKEIGATKVAIAYFGTAPLAQFDLPETVPLSPQTPTSGYVAISAHELILEHARNGSYAWLRRHGPGERIGSSIFLFHIPAQVAQP